MLKPALLPSSHEELFIACYRQLLSSAVRLTDGDRGAAEDLVQDAFIQFTLKRPDLNGIESLNDYLYAMIRNLHISRARRASQSRTEQLVISNYDTAQIGLRLLETQRHLQVRDDLRRVCDYATQRKETSKAGSVLILRFFHNYFPLEIASILRSTRTAVEAWLLNARRESRLILDDPSGLKIHGRQTSAARKLVEIASRAGSHKNSDIFSELREMIFSSRQGTCFTRDQLHELYHAGNGEAVRCKPLAHIVSCQRCLETANQVLGLPSLAERFSPTSIDQGEDPPSGSGGTSGFGPSNEEVEKQLRRRRREIFEHRPKALQIAVNGFFVGGQKIGLTVNELTLKLNLEEKISFVEAFSEQGLLLSHFRVTPPTDGEIEQRERVEFAEGRALDIAVNFETQWPTLHVVYRDPLVAQLQTITHDAEATSQRSVSEQAGPQSHHANGELQVETFWRARLAKIFRAQLLWRPATITAIVALLLVAIVFFRAYRSRPAGALTATEVLERATKAEELASASKQTVIHRTLQIEEHRGSLRGDVVARRRVEVWQSTEKGITAQRLYDERGRLIAGKWTRADSAVTLYHHGSRPQLKPVGPPLVQLNLESVWQLSPSAKDFARLAQQSLSLRLEEHANHYVLSLDDYAADNDQKLIQARLVLSREDFHAVEQSFLVQHGAEISAYRIIETSFERRPNEAVAPAVFEPEPELIGSNQATQSPEGRIASSPRFSTTRPSIIATAALEVEVLQLLNQANAFMGEQLSVTRTSDGQLLVSGLIDTSERKAELLRTLEPVRANPAVKIQLETAAEVAKRERPKRAGNQTVVRVETTEGTSAIYSDLKQKFSDEVARRFADRVMSQSRQARRHALALRQLVERFSLEDLRTLSPEDRARWIGLLRGHASGFEREIAALRRDLQTVIPALSEPGNAPAGSGGFDDAQLQKTVMRLYGLSVTCDERVLQSFALSADQSSGAPVRTAQFWQALSAAETLSKAVLRMTSSR